MLCEMCGKDVETTSRVRLERTVLGLCPDCAKFGTPVDPPPPAPAEEGSPVMSRSHSGGAVVTATRPEGRPRRLEERDLYQEIGELELAPDWGRKVRIARETLGWNPEELGEEAQREEISGLEDRVRDHASPGRARPEARAFAQGPASGIPRDDGSELSRRSIPRERARDRVPSTVR